MIQEPLTLAPGTRYDATMDSSSPHSSLPATVEPSTGTGRQMHICLVSQEYPPETAHGGIGSQAYMKAHGLSARGHRVHVISRNANEQTSEYDDGPVRVIRIPGLEFRFPVNTTEVDWLTYSTQVAAAISDLHKQQPVDLLEFAEWGCEGYVYLLNQTQWNRIPTVIHLHGPLVMFAHAIGWPEVDSEFYRAGMAMEGACLRLADRVYSSSRCSADWCARYHGISPANIETLHMGIDRDLFHRRDVPRDSRLTVVFVGNLADNKGAPLLAEAACRIAPQFPDLKVTFIGKPNPKMSAKLKSMAAAAGFPGLLEFPGFVRREDLPGYLSRAHLLAVPSSYEGGPGFVYLEAMACELPVIACSGSGAAEVVTPGENGLLVAPHDRGELAAALTTLLASTELRHAMGAAGLQYVQQHADTRLSTLRLEALYASVIAQCASAGKGAHA